MEKPVEWVWYGRDNDGESHISLGRWKRHSCQMRYKLAEIQPTEHDRAIPTIDPAAIREAALKEALSLPKHAHTSYGAMRPDDLGCWVHTDDLTALIGEKK